MIELSDKEIKEYEKNVLEKVVTICENNNINYVLCGGTTLGAIRHKGFIPWDDDVDLSLCRNDYEKLIQYFENNDTGSLKLVTIYNNKNYSYLFAKIYDNTTIVKDELIRGIDETIGLGIDLFPIDGLGENVFEAKKTMNKDAFLRELLVASNWKKYKKSVTHNIIYEPIRFIMFLLSRIINPNKLAKYIDGRIDKNKNSIYMGCICGAHRLNEIFENKVYNEFVKVEFENRNYTCSKYYKEYLSQFYGDYMKLPSEKEQQSHHTFKAYRK